MSNYVSLHNHSEYSNLRLLDSINKINDLIKHAHDIGLSGVALTDHESLSGHVKAQSYVEEQKKKNPEAWKDFKLMLGNEIYLCRDGLNGENYKSGVDKYYHFILIAKDAVGHQQLRELSSRAWNRSYIRFMRRCPTYYSDIEEIVGANPGHLIASTACIGGFLGSKILEYGANAAKKTDIQKEICDFIDWCQKYFGEDFYFELQPSYGGEQRFVNGEIVKMVSVFEVPMIITTDSHYLKKEDRKIHKAYLNSKDGDREVDDFYASTYLMTPEEIHEYMDDNIGAENVEECFTNTLAIADKCEDYSLFCQIKVPYIPLRAFEDNEDIINIVREYEMNGVPMVRQFFESDWASDHDLAYRLAEIYNDIYKEDGRLQERFDRIETELKILWNSSRKMNMAWSAYSLQVSDYVNIYWTKANSLVGPGRGSAVGEYINYLLGITQVDPTRETTPLMYWRYLNPERASVLDIDIDIESAKRDGCIKSLQSVYGKNNVVRVCTFGTEGAKNAIQTACRSLGVDVDIAHYLSSMVSGERGIQYNLSQVFYGDEENGIAPNRQFVDEMTNNYPEVWEVAQGIEGLVNRIGQHAGGVIIVDEDFTKHNAFMMTQKGEVVSQFELHDSEKVGQIKIDLLATEATDKIRACLDLLVQYGKIEKKATLRETYENAIGVYNLERNNPKMWEMVWNNQITSLFQMEKDSGVQGIALTKPKSVDELAILNSAIRLMAPEKGAEQPLNMWARYREDIEEWYREMRIYGLTTDEIEFLANFSGIVDGICATQEGMMMLVQEPRVAGMSLAWADKCRKAIAKKQGKLFEECEKEYYEAVKANGCSEKLSSYVWEVLLRVQRGYSFNLAHTFSYSIVALQEMNLAFRFPIIYWNCANLIVDSGSAGEIGSEDEEDEEPTAEEPEEEIVSIYESEDYEEYEYEDLPDRSGKKKKKARSVAYGKISSAIGKMKSYGINVSLPDINESNYSFTPDETDNTIRYGIKGITRVGDTLVDEIIDNRPYYSFADFIERIKVNKTQIVNLIKSGCFDKIEAKSREEIMDSYLLSIADTKSRLTLQNMPSLIREDLIPEEMSLYSRLFNFNKFLKKCKVGLYYGLTEEAFEFIESLGYVDMVYEDMTGTYANGAMRQTEWDKVYKKAMEPMRLYLKDPANKMLEKLNQRMIDVEKEKAAQGSTCKWEMDSVGFYNEEHELQEYYNKGYLRGYELSNFSDLSEEPEVASTFTPKSGGNPVPIFRLFHIAGTVIEKNKTKHSITLLCNNEVVNVKIWDSQFTKYDKQISAKMDDGKKKIIERSWFSRGNKIFLTGIRRGNAFVPKIYKSSDVDTPIMLIDDSFNLIDSRCDDE